jgi:hypothetical protein
MGLAAPVWADPRSPAWQMDAPSSSSSPFPSSLSAARCSSMRSLMRRTPSDGVARLFCNHSASLPVSLAGRRGAPAAARGPGRGSAAPGRPAAPARRRGPRPPAPRAARARAAAARGPCRCGRTAARAGPCGAAGPGSDLRVGVEAWRACWAARCAQAPHQTGTIARSEHSRAGAAGATCGMHSSARRCAAQRVKVRATGARRVRSRTRPCRCPTDRAPGRPCSRRGPAGHMRALSHAAHKLVSRPSPAPHI